MFLATPLRTKGECTRNRSPACCHVPTASSLFPPQPPIISPDPPCLFHLPMTTAAILCLPTGLAQEMLASQLSACHCFMNCLPLHFDSCPAAPSVSAANQPPALVSVTGGAATSSTAVTSPDPATVPSTSDSGSASAGSGSSAGAQGRYTAGSSPADTPSQPPSLSPSEGVLVRRDPWHVARTPAEAEKGIWDPEAASSRRWHTRPSEGAQEPQVGPAQSGNRAAPFYRERRRGAVFVSEPEDGGPTIWELGPDGVPMRSSIGNQASRASRGPPAEYLDPSAYPWGDAGKVSDFPEFSSFSGYSDAYDLPTGPQQGGDEGEEGQGDSSGTGVTGEERSAAGTATGGMKPHVGGAFVPAPVDTKGSLVSFKQQPQPQRSRSAWKLPGLQPKAGSDSAVVVKAVVEDAQVQAVTALTLLKVTPWHAPLLPLSV